MLHYVTPCFVTSTDQGVWTVSSCFVTNETNEIDHQWKLLLVCFICFILFQSILEYSWYILIVSSVSVTEKKTCPKKTCVVFVQYLNYSVAYEETQSNRVSDFRDFVCSMFPKVILFFTFISVCCRPSLYHRGIVRLLLVYEPAHDKTYKKTCVNSEYSDQPVHPPSMARVLVHPSLDSPETVEGTCDQRKLWSDCADAQADLSLR